jgi:hypothetical protein
MKVKTTSPILFAIPALAVHANAENLVKNAGSVEGWSYHPTSVGKTHPHLWCCHRLV